MKNEFALCKKVKIEFSIYLLILLLILIILMIILGAMIHDRNLTS